MQGSLADFIQPASGGDAASPHDLFAGCYADLRRLARSRLGRHERGVLLDTTALVHEAYLRFSQSGELTLADRQHFLCYASRVMRSVIVDLVREQRAVRRGGDATHVTLNTSSGGAAVAGEEQILRVHEALADLGHYDERMVQVVEMRYFAGMTETEIARALGITDRTVRRVWEKARLLLAEALGR